MKGKAGKGISGFANKKPPVGKVGGGSFGGGKKGLKGGGGKGGVKGASADPKINPFEARNNGKAKHEVLNRRVKGSNRNVAKARGDAHARRTKTLLVEHRAKVTNDSPNLRKHAAAPFPRLPAARAFLCRATAAAPCPLPPADDGDPRLSALTRAPCAGECEPHGGPSVRGG